MIISESGNSTDWDWLSSFQAINGRPLRVLHIGNIANNAYLNAKILNQYGVDNDVLCYDYYHIMSCPEWEDADFAGAQVGNQDYPDWESINTGGYQRPSWFIQGPLAVCTEYLRVRRQGRHKAAGQWGTIADRFRKLAAWQGGKTGGGKLLAGKLYSAAAKLFSSIITLGPGDDISAIGRKLVADFARALPERADKLSLTDIEMRQKNYPTWSRWKQWRRLLDCYDIVIGYSTDGCYPLLTGKRPYLAYEHGTIRDIPFNQTLQGRLCAATFRLADTSLITNCDNIKAAKALGLEDYRFVPHPVNEDISVELADSEKLRQELVAALQCDYIVFHPSRQHWTDERHPSWEKGNDRFIYGFARFVKEVNPNAAAVFVEWGQTVAESKQLLVDLGVDNRVVWIPPQGNKRMLAYIRACDLLADQFHLGAFGSTMPKALLCERPAMLYVDEEIHRWCFPELPPIINARTADEVFQGLSRLYLDKQFSAELAARGRRWYDMYHSNRVIAGVFGQVFQKVLQKNGV